MAIPKKKSRVISIDNDQYRWIVGPNDGYSIFVAEKENIKGQKIKVYFQQGTLWATVGDKDNTNRDILKPKNTEIIIRQALQLGWTPDEKGKALVFDWFENKLVNRTVLRF